MNKPENIELLNKIIEERENQFQHALSDAADSQLLNHMKSDLDFLKEKRKMLFENLESDQEKNIFRK